MGAKTKIEWTDATWNPVRGCTKISPGCKHCYAERFAERFRGVEGHPFEQGFDLRLVPTKIDEPLRWKTPQRIFVNSMSDLFHDQVPLSYIKRVFRVMNEADWHQYQVLTKRAERLDEIAGELQWAPHIWMGVSVENKDYLWRIDHLRRTKAHIKFLSIEPLLGPIGKFNLGGIDWVIVGGESGPGARPFDIQWARNTVYQCRQAGVACFVKQLGADPKEGNIRLKLKDRKGGDWGEWPKDLKVREFPNANR